MKNHLIAENRLIDDLRYLWSRHELIRTWTLMNIHAQYINTKLGLVWIFLEPLITTMVYTLAFGELLRARPPRGGVPFICFYLSGIVFWKFFSSCITKSLRSIISNIGLMTEVRFPRESAVLVDFLQNMVDFFASFLIMMIILAFYGIYPNQGYVFIPLILLVTSMITIGLMFFFSSLSVFIQDIGQIIGPILRLLFFISGVIFQVENAPQPYGTLLQFNPMLLIIESFRNIVLYGETPDMRLMAGLGLAGIIMLIAGYRYFKKKDATFVDHL